MKFNDVDYLVLKTFNMLNKKLLKNNIFINLKILLFLIQKLSF